MTKVALIIGITGQDGAYLADFLLRKNYIVFGAFRRSSSVNFWRIKELGIQDNINLRLVEHDLTDLGSSISLIEKIIPDEIYNLAAQSFVGVSFEQPTTTAHITGLGPLYILEAIRLINKKIRFYQAGTSEMFGKVQEVPQNENTPFYPRSPYAVSKLFAHWTAINYRESYGIFASNGILFNHESPLRGLEFVTRKITHGVAQIKLGKLETLELGNLDSKRDWGFAKEYVEGMWKMLQIEMPDNFILATQRTETVREFVRLAFKAVDINIEFKGSGINEIGFNALNGKKIVEINSKYFRPSEVDLLIGDASKAKNILNWSPTTSLEELCSMMVKADIDRNNKDIFF